MKKRYFHNITSWDLPKKNERSIYLGKIAESHYEAYLDIDELTKHMIIAGSTGGGKTIAAQIIAEEAFSKGIAIAVIDPTAQWTGFIKELEENAIKKKYGNFGMKKDSAKSYPTRIINLDKNRHFTQPEEFLSKEVITVLAATDLLEREIDAAIAEIINLFFKNTSQEHEELQTLLFFEEIHRILPKYGGTGSGLIALERAVREFRKWGIGIVLISQVLEDFVGEIRANIGTEMQLRTSYEVDLDKIILKYGDEMAKAVVREETGTLMMHNSSYNIGKPFFINIRPPMHDVHRLSNKELQKYYLIDEKISELANSKLSEQDEFTIKLARKELLRGNMRMAETYVDEVSQKK